jgi:hypothetical protein
MTSRRNGSIGGEDATEGRTPGEEAIRVVFRDFKEAANAKISKICARPLVRDLHIVWTILPDHD